MRGELGEYADGLKGHIRLLSNTNALTEFLPEPLSQFLASHPQVNIDLEERLSDEIVAAVADGKADIGIVAGTEDVTGLEVFPFRVDRFVLVTAPASSRSPPRGRIAFADALDFDFVGLDRTSSLQRFLSDKAERIGRRLKLRVQLRSFDAVCRLVECNVGIGVVPETTAVRSMKTMALHRIELTDDWALRNLTICVRRLADLPLYAQELVRSLAGTSRNYNGAQRMLKRICIGTHRGERSRCGHARAADTVVLRNVHGYTPTRDRHAVVLRPRHRERARHASARRATRIRPRTLARRSSTAAARRCCPA